MAEKIDVRAAAEWAYLVYDDCVIRNDQNLPVSIDYSAAKLKEPLGGRQMLDMAFSNRAAFVTHMFKVLGTDLDDTDERMEREIKLQDSLRELLKRFEDAGKS